MFIDIPLPIEDTTITAMSSSSSTESGCDGPVNNDNSDNENLSGEKIVVEVQIEQGNVINNNYNHILGENSNTIKDSEKSMHALSKLDTTHDDDPPSDNENSMETTKDVIKYTDSSLDTNQKSTSEVLVQNTNTSTRNVEGDDKAFIEDILKEFDSPTSIYIPNGKINGVEKENQNSIPNGSEKSTMCTRRTSGAKASQIIKENSEMLEKMMRKRVNSVAGASNENSISLDKELLDIGNDNIDNDMSFEEILHNKNANKAEVMTKVPSRQIKAKSATTLPKNDTGKSNIPAKYYPAVSPIGPVNPQLSKPQLNPVGGIVVQQRSDGAMGGQNSTKPITFNPFPNSSRIGQRKSNEVGRKLGLYK